MTITEVTSQPTDAERFGHILAVQRAAYRRDGAPSLAARRSDLSRFKAALIARRGAIEEAINADFGNRSRHESAMMEVGGVVQGIDYLQRHLRRFMRPTGRHTAWHMHFGSNRIEYQPLGVVGVISPWNYPVNLALMPVVTAIAAGNRVMLKPSKFTPATNTVLASMLSELFLQEQVTIVNGDGAAFSSLPFDHLVVDLPEHRPRCLAHRHRVRQQAPHRDEHPVDPPLTPHRLRTRPLLHHRHHPVPGHSGVLQPDHEQAELPARRRPFPARRPAPAQVERDAPGVRLGGQLRPVPTEPQIPKPLISNRDDLQIVVQNRPVLLPRRHHHGKRTHQQLLPRVMQQPAAEPHPPRTSPGRSTNSTHPT